MTISFNNQYKGHFIKKLKLRLNNVLWSYIISFIFIFVGIYILFFRFHRLLTIEDTLLAYSSIVIGLICFVVLPILSLVKPINKKIKGIINIEIDGDTIKINANNYYENGKINLIEKKKDFIKISVIGKGDYYIPLSEISSEEKEELFKLEQEISELRKKRGCKEITK